MGYSVLPSTSNVNNSIIDLTCDSEEDELDRNEKKQEK